MDYKIISFNKNTGSILVEYSIDHPPIVVDVPLDESELFIIGNELDSYIQGFIPTWHLNRIDRLQKGIANSDVINDLVISPSNISTDTQSSAVAQNEARDIAQALEDQMFTAKVLAILTEQSILPK